MVEKDASERPQERPPLRASLRQSDVWTSTPTKMTADPYGHETASGDRFHQSDHTAASNKLPLGTTAKVTNLKTGKKH
jgi:hypothetical protein